MRPLRSAHLVQRLLIYVKAVQRTIKNNFNYNRYTQEITSHMPALIYIKARQAHPD